MFVPLAANFPLISTLVPPDVTLPLHDSVRAGVIFDGSGVDGEGLVCVELFEVVVVVFWDGVGGELFTYTLVITLVSVSSTAM